MRAAVVDEASVRRQRRLLSPFAPQPDPQSTAYDEGHGTGPERDVLGACRHTHLEEDSKQLRKGDEPE